jgi:hypothetical protein
MQNDKTKKEVCKFENFLQNDKELTKLNFEKCIRGFHLINASVINETKWEEINALLFKSLNIEIYSKSNGGHLSGMDIDCSLGKISNKSSKYTANKKGYDISSYRLTTVCSEKNCGTPEKFIEEINKRKNFDYYSFIVRDEMERETKEIMKYDWYLIPCDYTVLDPASYVWEPTIGKKGKNKDTQIGWHTNKINGSKMSINFSMSSQLWIHIEMTDDIKKCIIASAETNSKPKYNYIDIADKFMGL